MAITRVKLKPVILSLVVIAGVEVAMGMLAAQSFSSSLAVSGAGRIIEAMMVLLIFRCQPNGLAAIGLSYATLPIGLRHGLIWSLGMGFAVFVGFVFLFALGVDAFAWFSLHLPGGFSEQVIFFLVAGVISPVAEELFFRGILLLPPLGLWGGVDRQRGRLYRRPPLPQFIPRDAGHRRCDFCSGL